jgi:hypothetical protein
VSGTAFLGGLKLLEGPGSRRPSRPSHHASFWSSQPQDRMPCGSSLFLASLWLPCVIGCSFLVASYDLSARHSAALLQKANERQRLRGPDLTAQRQLHGWSFVHNLLSMTGPPTPQPFTNPASDVVAVFNGEIYNFRKLAQWLGVNASSDGGVHFLTPGQASPSMAN